VARKPACLRALDELDALRGLILLGPLFLQRERVALPYSAGPIGWGIKLKKLQRDGMQAGAGYLVVGERLIRQRIIDRRRKNFGEVAVAHGCRGNAVDALALLPQAEAFEIRHEEKPVLAVKQLWYLHRAAQREAVLIPAEWGFGGYCAGEGKRAGIQGTVAKELEQCSVVLVGAAFC